MAKNEVVMAPKNESGGERYVPDPDFVRAIEDRLVTVRLSMLLHIPFWGQLATALELQDGSGWCPTAATDGRRLYYNVNFIDKLTDKELQFLLAHEIEHCAFSHMLRNENRDPHLFNIACDFAVNLDLVQGGIGDKIESALYDEKYDNMSAEEIFEDLVKDAKSKAKANGMKTLDEHLEADEGEEGGAGDGEGDGEGGAGDGEGDGYKPGDENNRPSISKQSQEQIQREVRSAVTAAAKAAEASNKAGSIPAGMRRLINSWSESTVDWRNYIQERILTTMKDDFSFLRPRRRGELPGGIIMPGRDNLETVTAHIAVDTSGSMGEQMLRDLMGEVAGVMEQFTDVEVHIWCFDGEVIEESYKKFDTSNLDDIYSYKLMGGGGTLFESNWRWMKEKEIEPKTFLLFTDGYPCDSWGDPIYCPTIFLVHSNNEAQAPFGTTLYYEPKKPKSNS